MRGWRGTPGRDPQQHGFAASRRSALLLGLGAAVVGAIQLWTTLVGVTRTHLVTVIAALGFYSCGSLLVVGTLVLVDLWRDHGKHR